MGELPSSNQTIRQARQKNSISGLVRNQQAAEEFSCRTAEHLTSQIFLNRHGTLKGCGAADFFAS